MVRKFTIEENETIEINGAVLTPRVIRQIELLQEHDNDTLNRVVNDMADAVCFVITEAVDYQGIDREIRRERLLDLALGLSYYRDYLKELQKPEHANKIILE